MVLELDSVADWEALAFERARLGITIDNLAETGSRSVYVYQQNVTHENNPIDQLKPTRC